MNGIAPIERTNSHCLGSYLRMQQQGHRIEQFTRILHVSNVIGVAALIQREYEDPSR
jgi:hypothetical protein